MKRFYKKVSISDDLGILLDGRPVRTPERAPLLLLNAAMAEAVVQEWDAQSEEVDPRSMPITGLANAVIDRVMPDPSAFASPLAAYGESELLCYRADAPPELVARQAEQWDLLLDWASQRYDIAFTRVTGIMHKPQPEATPLRLATALLACSPWQLAALNPIISIAGSLVLALAIVEKAIDPDQAFATAHLDEIWQAEQWGEDDWALDLRRAHERDFLNACRFLSLLD